MKNIIFMIDIKLDDKPDRTNAYQYSIKSWQHFADKNDAELFILTEPLFDPKEMSLTWQRYYLFELLENSNIEYDQVLMVDSDTICLPDCLNFFNMTDNKYCAVHNFGNCDWLFRSIENYSKHLFDGYMFSFDKYVNGGMQIINKFHKPFFNEMIKFYNKNKEKILWMQNNFHVGTDQPCLNFLLNIYNIDVKLLPYEFNGQSLEMFEGLQLLENGRPLFSHFCHIAHFNAISHNKNSNRSNEWMKLTYEYFYGRK